MTSPFNRKLLASAILMGLAALSTFSSVHAATTVTAGASTSTSSTATSTPQTRLAGEYATLAGSEDNARALVSGLRTKSTITLAPSTTATTATAPSASFTPATQKMGYGNIAIALGLAQTSLAQQGITNPTPDQLAAALNGGLVTTPTKTVTFAGVLTQRASGLGWGQIAKSMGVKLGNVVSASAKKNAAQADAGSAARAGKTQGVKSTSTNASKTGLSASAGKADGNNAGGTGGSGGGRGGGHGGGKK
ncbi:MAG: hypothetical protein V4731_01335 [Pseudomonadota bacterium]